MVLRPIGEIAQELIELLDKQFETVAQSYLEDLPVEIREAYEARKKRILELRSELGRFSRLM